MKKVFNSGAVYIFVAVLFIIAAVSNTISDDSTVIALLWICACVFALLGALQLKKSITK